jgi:peptide/nickel transport system permease protein
MYEARLSFLGFGVPPGVPSWGSMLSNEGRAYMEADPALALWPGACLTVAVYGINMFGDALRDLLDPRLRGGVGRYSIKEKNIKKLKESLTDR